MSNGLVSWKCPNHFIIIKSQANPAARMQRLCYMQRQLLNRTRLNLSLGPCGSGTQIQHWSYGLRNDDSQFVCCGCFRMIADASSSATVILPLSWRFPQMSCNTKGRVMGTVQRVKDELLLAVKAKFPTSLRGWGGIAPNQVIARSEFEVHRQMFTEWM